MSEHGSHTVQRHCDVVVVGGSAAGLAAALQLGRQRRSVIVVDAGEPRNAPAAHMHGYLGHEGLPPVDLLALGREEVRSYGGEILSGRVTSVTGSVEAGFRVEVEGGREVVARRVLAASGLVDELPDIEGLADHWGGDVIHCPFCHGYEVRDRRIVQIITHPMGLHPAPLFNQLTDRLTLVLHDGVDGDHPEVVALRAAGVAVVERRARRIVTGADGRVEAVELEGGEELAADAVAIGPRFAVRAQPFSPLGLEAASHPSGLGDFVETDRTGATSVPGLYAAGNVTDPSQQVLQAAAHGSRVGAMISFSLAHDDVEAAARTSAVESDWDHRYSGDHLWSGNPNGALVQEVEAVAPGRALDIGAGEGGDAIWLAGQGWKVTANDVSANALDRIAAVAAERDLTVECQRADANDLDAFDEEAYDLVSAFYVPIPRSPDGRGVANLLRAVAPGGTLLVVGHDLEPHLGEGGAAHNPFFDHHSFVGIDEVAAAVEARPGWEVEVHETRPRPAGAASTHVADIVLRARRLAG